jgi:hypothetical protein
LAISKPTKTAQHLQKQHIDKNRRSLCTTAPVLRDDGGSPKESQGKRIEEQVYHASRSSTESFT